MLNRNRCFAALDMNLIGVVVFGKKIPQGGHGCGPAGEKKDWPTMDP
jgi:hypothetical protein